MRKIRINIKQRIFLIEYIIFFPISFIGSGLVNPYFDSIGDRLTSIVLFGVHYFVVKFFLYRYFKSFDLKPLISIILAFIITFHFFVRIPVLLLTVNWIELWKLMYSEPHLILRFTMPAYLAFFTIIYLYLDNKRRNYALQNDLKI